MSEPVVRGSVPAYDTAAIKDPTPKKRPLWRRILRRVRQGLTAIVVLVVIALIFIHTSWGKSVIRGRIESKLGAAVNGEVTLGSLDYTFMFGSIELGDLEIKDASGKPAIKIAKIAVDLDRGSLLHGAPVLDSLEIDGLAVDLVQKADGTTNLTGLFKPSDRKPLEHITVSKLAIGGSATITKPDGTVIAVTDLSVGGSVDARPAGQQVEAAIGKLGAKLAITPPKASGKPTKNIAVALEDITVKRGPDHIDVDVSKIDAGALGIENLGAHVALVDGKPHGLQNISIGKARVDSKQLTALLGKQLLLDDVKLDLSVTGPEDKLVIKGGVKTRATSLTIDGTADISKARPSYTLSLVGKGRSADVAATNPKLQSGGPLEVESDVRIDIAGSGAVPTDLEATVGVAVGPTKVGKLAVDSVTAKAKIDRGAYHLDELIAKGLDFTITASGDMAVDKSLTAKVNVAGSPAKAVKILAAAGIAVPRNVPNINKLDITINATGRIDGELAVDVEPTKIAIAGGTIGISGNAKLLAKKLQTATTKIRLDHLDLAGLSALAGRPPKARGTLSGTIDLTREGLTQHGTYGLTIALADKPLIVTAKGNIEPLSATAHAKVLRKSDGSALAVIDATIPLDAKGFQPAGKWKVTADVAKRALSEIAELLPEDKRAKIPAGDVAIHAELGGSPMAPTGTVTIDATAAALTNLPEGAGPQKVHVTLALAPGKLTPSGTVELDLGAGSTTVAAISGAVKLPALFIGGKPNPKLRDGLDIDLAIELPERSLDSLATLRPKLAELGGSLSGMIKVKGSPAAPALDASIKWAGYETAAGTKGETTIHATGTPKQIAATITHGAATITADVDRSNPDRTAIVAHMRAPKTALRPLLPALLAAKLGANDAGSLTWNMDANVALSKTPDGMLVDTLAITGALDVTGASIKIPGSERSYHDVGLSIAGDPSGIRIKGITARESDVEKQNRSLDISGLVTLDKTKPQKVELTLGAKDWLVFGGDKLGKPDAPRATATFDIGVAVDLTTPTIGVDATIRQFALNAPDRMDRAHEVEDMSPNGDIIYVTDKTVVGKLPVAPVVVAEEKKPRKPMDIRVHIPQPIRVEQTPLSAYVQGELGVTIRDEGVKTRGTLTATKGTLNLFGHEHSLVVGKLSFTDEHPHGWLEMTFDRKLPDVAMRQLSRSAGTAKISLAGEPGKQKTRLDGAANSAMLEVMAMYNAGRPINTSRPGLPASETVTAPHGDQLFVETFMASNLPHLLFLDRIDAWADPYQGAGSYGQISNMEAEHYAADGKTRVRAVVRPTTVGRSNAELQYDKVFVNDDRKALGVGVRAGDRLGGGVGVFFEWSSKE